jgi:threonylcarbamoyladenosine tRNA methylthiotransferase MtaB
VGSTALSAPNLADGPLVYIMNTCAVTAEATREAVKQIRRIKAKEPLATVVVTGCGAQVDGAVYDGLPGADLVVANSHKGQLSELLDRHFRGEIPPHAKVFRSNIFRKEDLEPGGGEESGHVRSFLKIQDGCNSFCTFCVIPFARGKSRSLSRSELVRRVQELRRAGVQEIVLTGVHIGDYEDGEGAGLDALVGEILEKTDVPRLRLTSLEPIELTQPLMRHFQNPRLCPHFHMSIQSANTKTLSAMRRNYTAEDVERALNWISADVPGAFVGMDVIAGFPGETEDDFLDTYQRLDRLPWSRLHVFPYSERPGTRAVSLPDSVPRPVRAARAQRLRELSSHRLEASAAGQIGQVKMGLVVKQKEDHLEAVTPDYWTVRLSRAGQPALERGEVAPLRITRWRGAERDRMDGFLEAEWI